MSLHQINQTFSSIFSWICMVITLLTFFQLSLKRKEKTDADILRKQNFIDGYWLVEEP